MQIKRHITKDLIEKIKSSNKGIVLYGARQVGKTTLVNEIINNLHLKTLMVDGDQSKYMDIFSSRNLEKIKSLVSGFDLLFIDEAQRIPEIGINLKIIFDNIPTLKVIVTGSSSLDLASQIREPLTGRVWTYHLYPISLLELSKTHNRFQLSSQLDDLLVYGSYPELFSFQTLKEKEEYLVNLADAYLYKDLLAFEGLKNSIKIRDLLKLLAFQVGSQVSLSELGRSLSMSKETVAKYIDFLEKSSVLMRLKGFSRNLRKEIVKMDKIYFIDLGIRNILIGNTKPLTDRNDIGQLWENFLIVERTKSNAYLGKNVSQYFWRTYTGAELDYIEERDGTLKGFEFKYGEKIRSVPNGWIGAYPEARYQCINASSYLDFLL